MVTNFQRRRDDKISSILGHLRHGLGPAMALLVGGHLLCLGVFSHRVAGSSMENWCVLVT